MLVCVCGCFMAFHFAHDALLMGYRGQLQTAGHRGFQRLNGTHGFLAAAARLDQTPGFDRPGMDRCELYREISWN